MVLRLICRVGLFIHDTNFTMQVLAAMTMIIKFLPHYLQGGSRRDRERGDEGRWV